MTKAWLNEFPEKDLTIHPKSGLMQVLDPQHARETFRLNVALY